MDDIWLLAATTLWYVKGLSVDERVGLLDRARIALDEVGGGGHGDDAEAQRLWRDIGLLFGVLGGSGGGAPQGRATGHDRERSVADAVAAVLPAAEALESQGGFHLTFSFWTAVRELTPASQEHDLGLVVAQQARIARQVGALSKAADLYRAAERMARRRDDAALLVRSLLGQGVLANVRGNFPSARSLFRRALRVARSTNLSALAGHAHHGLLIAALKANDLDAALRHGWAAFQEAEAHPDRRAEVLCMLGEVLLRADHPAAGMAAYQRGLELTMLARIRLPLLGGAAKAAARLGLVPLLERLRERALDEVRSSGLAFENALLLVELAEAHAHLGFTELARHLAGRAAGMAREGQFFELSHRAEGLLEHLGAEPAPRRQVPSSVEVRLSAQSRSIVQSIEALHPRTPAGVGSLVCQNHG